MGVRPGRVASVPCIALGQCGNGWLCSGLRARSGGHYRSTTPTSYEGPASPTGAMRPMRAVTNAETCIKMQPAACDDSLKRPRHLIAH